MKRLWWLCFQKEVQLQFLPEGVHTEEHTNFIKQIFHTPSAIKNFHKSKNLQMISEMAL